MKIQKDTIKITLLLVQTLLIVVLMFQVRGVNNLLSGGAGDAGSAGNAIAPSGPGPEPSEPRVANFKVLEDDDAVLGDKKAPVTIVEFSDFECPFCGRFFQQTFPQINENYIKTGKVKLIYRDFPLGFHAQAQKAAEAAECAGEQEKYYKMHDKLFTDGVQGGVASFKIFAADIGLNTAKFNDCLDSGKMASEVQKDQSDGAQYGVSGTPAFFVNGQLISGAQPYEAFAQAIEQALNN